MIDDKDTMIEEDNGEDTRPCEEKTLSREQELEAEVDKLKDQLLRTVADFENYRKRAEREREDTAKYAVTSFARDLLAVSDNLRRALESIPEDHQDAEKLLGGLLKGVEITETELLSVFKKHAIEKIYPLGEVFDHQLHQAMFEVEEREKAPGTIVQVLQPGYTLYGRLLRPAFVGVAKSTKTASQPLNSEDMLPT